MNFRNIATAAAFAGSLALAMPAQATPDTGSVAVSATLTAVCYIGDGTLAFGNIASIGQGGTAGTVGDAADTAAPTSQPVSIEKKTASRPASHKRTSAKRGRPCTGRRPVQFGIAVSRNPVTIAAR